MTTLGSQKWFRQPDPRGDRKQPGVCPDRGIDPLILSQGVACNSLTHNRLPLTVCRLCAKFLVVHLSVG